MSEKKATDAPKADENGDIVKLKKQLDSQSAFIRKLVKRLEELIGFDMDGDGTVGKSLMVLAVLFGLATSSLAGFETNTLWDLISPGSKGTCKIVQYYNTNTLYVDAIVVGKSSTLSNTVTYAGTLNSNLFINGWLIVSNTTVLSNTTEQVGKLTCDTNVAVSGQLAVAAPTALSGATVVSNTLGVTGHLTASTNVTINGPLAVAGTGVALSGPLAVSNTITATGAATLTGGVTGDGFSISDTSGNAIFAGSVTSTGTLAAVAAATVGTTLGVSGIATLNTNVIIKGSLTISNPAIYCVSLPTTTAGGASGQLWNSNGVVYVMP